MSGYNALMRINMREFEASQDLSDRFIVEYYIPLPLSWRVSGLSTGEQPQLIEDTSSAMGDCSFGSDVYLIEQEEYITEAIKQNSWGDAR
jgi:hypothetical protein